MDNTDDGLRAGDRITAAFLKLLEDKPLEEISVSEIAAAAGVSRVSFYRSFERKEDIPRARMDALIGRWRAGLPDGSDGETLSSLLEHLRANSEFYMLLSRRGLSYLLRDVLVGLFGPKRDSSASGAYTAAFIAFGLYGLIEEWFARGMAESPEEIAELFSAGR